EVPGCAPLPAVAPAGAVAQHTPPTTAPPTAAPTPQSPPSAAPTEQSPPLAKELYTKLERKIPMRDGVELHAAIYLPKDTSQPHPILLDRTPYSCSPYGEEKYRES